MCGKVQYCDHEKDELPKRLFMDEDRLFHKADFYRDESEFRIITFLNVTNFEFDATTGLPPAKSLEDPKYIQSQTIPVSLEELIEEVRVSPYAPPWFKPLVATYVERAGAFPPGFFIPRYRGVVDLYAHQKEVLHHYRSGQEAGDFPPSGTRSDQKASCKAKARGLRRQSGQIWSRRWELSFAKVPIS